MNTSIFKTPLALTAATLLAGTHGANAATIVDFDFSGVDGTVVHAKESFEVTATTTLAGGITVEDGVNIFSPSTATYTTAGGAATNDLNVTLTANAFISYTVSVDSGFELDLNSATFSFDLRRNGGAAASLYTLLLDGVQVGSQFNTGGSTSVLSPTFTLAATGFDGLTGSHEVRLRSDNGAGNTHFSGATLIDGTVTAIPEPSSAILAVFGLLACGRRRNRRRD